MNRFSTIVVTLIFLAFPLINAIGTDGWSRLPREMVAPLPDNPLWQADLNKGMDAFTVEKLEGAEGSVTLSSAGMRIEKTNEAGFILVTPRVGFCVEDGKKLRAFAEVVNTAGSPSTSIQCLRLLDSRRKFGAATIEGYTVSNRGGPSETFAVNTEVGGVIRKFADNVVSLKDKGFLNRLSETNVVPALLIAGTPSVMTVCVWGVADLEKTCKQWESYVRGIRAQGCETRNYATNLVSWSEVERRLSGEPEHTADIVSRDGYSRFVVDGLETPLILYKDVARPKVNCGRRMAEAGVRIQALTMPFGGRLDQPNRLTLWTTNGFDTAHACEAVKEAMCRSPEALFFLSLAVNPPIGYDKANPDEVWRDENGDTVYGAGCRVYTKKDGPSNPLCWPWISMYSRVWREDAKKCLTKLADELRKNGLAKRIIGVHISGFHDGQFAPVVTDHSRSARLAFGEWLKRRYGSVGALSAAWKTPVVDFDSVTIPKISEYGNYSTGKDFFSLETDRRLYDYNVFQHEGGFEAQEELGRHVKSCFGKKIVTAKWCMNAFGGLNQGEYDFTRFCNTTGIDILIAQAGYANRSPGVPLQEYRVQDSFHLHRKLYMNELDYPTYLTGYAKNESNAIGRGWVPDYGAWETMTHKAAGQMFARRHGYWYYDMSGAAYDDDRQLSDIASVMRIAKSVMLSDRSDWRPSAAFVIDEELMMARNIVGRWMFDEMLAVKGQALRLAESGVPFDIYLADDLIRHPELANRYRTLVFTGMNWFDESRKRMVDSLACRDVTLVFVGGAGHMGGAHETLDINVVTRQRTMGHEVRPEPGWTCDEVRNLFQTLITAEALGEKGTWAADFRRPIRFDVEETPDMSVIARYVEGGVPAIVEKRLANARVVYVSDIAGLSPVLFNRLVRESSGYVSLPASIAQVEMNGGFVSLHFLRAGSFMFELPFEAEVLNLKNGLREEVNGRFVKVTADAGATYWFKLRRVFDVRDYGAKGDGVSMDTAAIQKALDLCGKTGGIVRLSGGTYKSGTIWLRDDTELRIEKDATFLGSDNLSDYNKLEAFAQNYNYSPEGWSAAHLILGVEVKNVAITGGGTIDGNARAFFSDTPSYVGKVGWRRGAIRAKDHQGCGRPGQEIEFVECENVTVKDVTFKDMACWSCFFYGTDHVRVGNVKVQNDLRYLNTDAFDIDCCYDVKIGDCDIVTGDDAFAVRGNPVYLKNKGRICRDVEISNCVCKVSACGVRVGVGDGVVKDIRISGLKILEAGRALNVQSSYNKNSRGVDISNVSFSDIDVYNAGVVASVTGGTEGSQASITDIVFTNVRGESLFQSKVSGAGITRPNRVTFKNCVIKNVQMIDPVIVVEKADDIAFPGTLVKMFSQD